MIHIIQGKHPEIKRICPKIQECKRQGMNHFILHTGPGMHGEQIGEMLVGAFAIKIGDDNGGKF